MAYYTVSLPVVSQTPGPAWASTLNQIITLVENHAHTGTDEQRITPAAMNINTDFSLGSTNRLLNAKAVQFIGQAASAAGGTYSKGFYTVGTGTTADLWYDNGSAAIQLTNGGAIIPTGTGNSNGFYGDYASVTAKTYFDNSTNQYRFYKDNVTTFSQLAGLALYTSQNGSQPVRIGAAWDGTNFRPTGGFAMDNGNGFQLMFDAVGGTAGAYSITSLFVTTSNHSNQYYMGLNCGANGGSGPVFPLDLQFMGSSTGPAPLELLVISATQDSGGAPGAGFGAKLTFRAATTSGSHSFNRLGSIEGFFSTNALTTSGLRFRGALSGSLTSTPGIELVNFAGSDAIGFGGAAVSGQVTTFYSTLWPSGGSVSLGDSTAKFLSLWLSANATIGGVLTVTGAATFSSTLSATAVTPTSAASAPVASAGGSFKNNQVLATCAVDGVGTVSGNYNVAGGGATWGSTGVCTVTLTTAVTSGVAIATISAGSGVAGATAQASVSGSTVTVKTFNGSATATSIAFSLLIVGSP